MRIYLYNSNLQLHQLSKLLLATIQQEPKQVPQIDLSNWMADLYPFIKDKKLAEIIIPGTHNSCSSKMYNKLRINWFRSFFAQNHESSCTIQQQLSDGIRYFDLRLKNFPSWSNKINPPFRLVHNNYNTYFWLPEILQTLKNFALRPSSKEILIIDLHKLYRFWPKDLVLLEEFLMNNLGEYLISKKDVKSKSISQLLQANQRIVLVVRNNHFYNHNLILDHIYSHWKNQFRPMQLKMILEEEELKRLDKYPCERSELHILQTVLTPHYIGIWFTILSSFFIFILSIATNPILIILVTLINVTRFIEETPLMLAATLNPSLINWFKEKLWKKNVNIFILDYHTLCDISEIILLNKLSSRLN